MRNLIAKQTAALAMSNNALDNYTPKLGGADQELLDAEQGDDSSKVLKDILKSINKMLFSVQATEDAVTDIKDMLKTQRNKTPTAARAAAAPNMIKMLETLSLVSIAKSSSEISQHTDSATVSRALPSLPAPTASMVRSPLALPAPTVTAARAGTPALLSAPKNITPTAARVEPSPAPQMSSAKRFNKDDVIDVESREVISKPEGADGASPFAEQIAAEQGAETTALMQKQVQLLEGILSALGGGAGAPKAEEKSKEKSGGSILGGILQSFFGEAAKGGIKGIAKNLFKGLLGGLLKTGLIGIVTAAVYGFINGFKVFFNGGSFSDALIQGLGSFLEFLTFGLFDKETVKKWVDGAMEIWNNLGKYFNEYVVEPIKNIVNNISTLFDEYIVQPIYEFVGGLSAAFDSYLVQPLRGFAESVTTTFDEFFVKPIAGFVESVTGVFTAIYEKIREFASKIPGLGRLFSSDDKKAAPVAPASSGSSAVAPKPSGQSAAVTPAAPPSSTAAAQAAPPSAVVVQNRGATTANAVYGTSSSNANTRDAMAAQPAQAPVVVSAPTTNVQNKQNISIPQPIRNPDEAFNRFNIRNRIA